MRISATDQGGSIRIRQKLKSIIYRDEGDAGDETLGQHPIISGF
jgi:hypothetical protein